MQTVSIPTITTPTPPPAAKPLEAPVPSSPPPLMRYPYPAYPGGYGYPPPSPYGWPGYPPVPNTPPMVPPAPESLPKPAVSAPATVPPPAEKVVEKPKTPEEKAEDELVDIFRQLLRSNPQIKRLLTPELLQQLRGVAGDPGKLQSLLIETVAKGQFGQQVKQFMGTGWLSRLAQNFALWLSPPQTDGVVSGFFKQLGIS